MSNSSFDMGSVSKPRVIEVSSYGPSLAKKIVGFVQRKRPWLEGLAEQPGRKTRLVSSELRYAATSSSNWALGHASSPPASCVARMKAKAALTGLDDIEQHDALVAGKRIPRSMPSLRMSVSNGPLCVAMG